MKSFSLSKILCVAALVSLAGREAYAWDLFENFLPNLDSFIEETTIAAETNVDFVSNEKDNDSRSEEFSSSISVEDDKKNDVTTDVNDVPRMEKTNATKTVLGFAHNERNNVTNSTSAKSESLNSLKGNEINNVTESRSVETDSSESFMDNQKDNVTDSSMEETESPEYIKGNIASEVDSDSEEDTEYVRSNATAGTAAQSEFGFIPLVWAISLLYIFY